MVEQVEKDLGQRRVHAYMWYEMSFFPAWTYPNTMSIFCFDLPLATQTKLRTTLASQQGSVDILGLNHWHSLLIDEIIDLYDESIWSLNGLVRGIEIVRHASKYSAPLDTKYSCQNRSSNHDLEPHFPLLHDLARHVLHSTETLQVAKHTLSSMSRRHVHLPHLKPSIQVVSMIMLR